MKRMNPGLRFRLTATYLLLILLATGLLGAALYHSFRAEYLQAHQMSKLTQARIIADQLAADAPADPRRAVLPVEELSRRFGARLLLLNPAGVVQVDSLGEFEGRRLAHPEVLQALEGRESARLQRLSGGEWAMYAAVPVVRGQTLRGVLLASYPMDEAVGFLAGLTRRIAEAVALSGALAIILSLWLAGRLAGPLRRLTAAVRRMAAGDLGSRVEAGGSGEIGVLAEAFNNMGERLQQSDASRRRFVADASHEMRTPLSSLQVLAGSLLARSGVDQPGVEVEEDLHGIQEETSRLSRLVDQLLELARIDAAEAMGVPMPAGPARPSAHSPDRSPTQAPAQPLDLGWAVRRAASQLLPLARGRGIVIDLEMPAGIQVSFEEDALESVFRNILDNAVKYSPGGGRVEVRTLVEGGMAAVTVRDHGHGIPPEALPHLFERFYRVDRARSRASGGFGLGLSIARAHVERHGGTITADSSPGGSIFTVHLPIFNNLVTNCGN
ncbi:MAG: HAMP domain-containing protein [Firmicutes bacterium]|nr:HAMP domain-containing protein [Bacillota bacterium]